MMKQGGGVDTMPQVARCGYRCRILAIFAGAFVALSATGALLTTTYVNSLLTSNELDELTRIAGTFARQSELALLYKSGVNAEREADSALAYPGITYVAIYDAGGTLLLGRGAAPSWAPTAERTPPRAVTFAEETSEAWHVTAPVYTAAGAAETAPFVLSQTDPEYLGFVHVVRTKETIEKLKTQIFLYTFVFTSATAIVLMVVMVRLLDPFIRPVDELADTLAKANPETDRVRVPEKGPPEIVNMARAFNRLMGLLQAHEIELRSQRDNLESQVQLRTAQLVQARDAALTASRHKSEFLAMISHELRTPLQAIMGYTESVMEELEEPDQDRLLDDLSVVLHAAEHLLAMINQMLDFARIEAGRVTLQEEDTDLEAFVAEMRDTALPLARQQGNALEARGVRKVVRIDREKLRQTALNLLGNACKFTRNGRIELIVTATDEELTVRVRDTGIGIAPEHHQHIFEAFRQIDMKETREHGGTGLGLAITEKLCRAMGGSIDVDSAPGRGSTFTVRLPVRPAGEQTDQQISSTR